MSTKRLTRSATDRKIAGICGGLGEYFNVDPVIFRIGFCFTLLMGGTGFILYLIMIFVVPERQTSFQHNSNPNDEIIIEDVSEKKKVIKDATMLVLGALFILLGIFFFIVRVFPFHFHTYFLPTLLVVGGFLLLIFSKKN